MINSERKLTSGAAKVEEYVSRIQGGESSEEIINGLPESFRVAIEAELQKDELKEAEAKWDPNTEEIVPPQFRGMTSEGLDIAWTITEYQNDAIAKEQKERKRLALAYLRTKEARQETKKKAQEDAVASANRANEIRNSLGIPEVAMNQDVVKQENNFPLEISKDDPNYLAFEELRREYEILASKSKSPKLLEDLFREKQKNNDRTDLSRQLFDYNYKKLREADYPIDGQAYEAAWDYANSNNSLGEKSHKFENNWIYRGNMPESGKKTETRGSLNVNISEGLIKELDKLIADGVIDANYKFGSLETQAAADSRHDAITIYFLKKPSPEAIKALSEIGQKYYRGNDMLGDKISDGFYISEIGSVSDKHARELLDKFDNIDPKVAIALRGYLMAAIPDSKTGIKRVAMSEAQFYAVKKTVNLFGYDIKYDTNSGFEIIK